MYIRVFLQLDSPDRDPGCTPGVGSVDCACWLEDKFPMTDKIVSNTCIPSPVIVVLKFHSNHTVLLYLNTMRKKSDRPGYCEKGLKSLPLTPPHHSQLHTVNTFKLKANNLCKCPLLISNTCVMLATVIGQSTATPCAIMF